MFPGKIARISNVLACDTVPRTKYELLTRKSTELSQPERVRDVLDLNPCLAQHHPHHVESVLISRTPVRSDPDSGGTGQLPPFLPPHRLRRRPEISGKPSPDFHERHDPTLVSVLDLARDEIKVAVTVSKAPIHDCPTACLEPTGRDRFALDPQTLPLCQHATSLCAGVAARESDYPPDSYNRCTPAHACPAIAGAKALHLR